MAEAESTILWQPTESFQQGSRLRHFMDWLNYHKNTSIHQYDDLWQWSVNHLEAFWECIWEYFDIIHDGVYSQPLIRSTMPRQQWFPGTSVSYAEHVFRNAHAKNPAIVFQIEDGISGTISWQTLSDQVASLAHWLRIHGIGPGDQVAAYLPNIPEATVAFLASNAVGATWSSCSPDFGAKSIQERFVQIAPRVLFLTTGYQYKQKAYDKFSVIEEVLKELPSIEFVVFIPYLSFADKPNADWVDWSETLSYQEPLRFTRVPFDHPIWILYSSGTTGVPKAITHSTGGILLEHLKYLAFHNDLKPGDRFFWYSTTGWMMWNMVQSCLLHGATMVLYEGHPGLHGMTILWKMAEELPIHHFGTSAPFLIACMKAGLDLTDMNWSQLRSISSTGAPLPPEAFDWVYEHLSSEVWLASMSGGTDVCTAFVGGVPLLPVKRGRIQRRALGCALWAYDEMGKPIYNEVGEMVITGPMPSMPIFFWNDPDHQRYLASYFEMYPGGIWRHGDWIQIEADGELIILGRSDATLNRQGVRIGTAEIYRVLNEIPQLADGLIVNLERSNGSHFMPLFVQLAEGHELNDELIHQIRNRLREAYSPRHVPDQIIPVAEIPYTISGKKLEAPVKKILMGMDVEKAANRGAMRNPQSLDLFVQLAKKWQDE